MDYTVLHIDSRLVKLAAAQCPAGSHAIEAQIESWIRFGIIADAVLSDESIQKMKAFEIIPTGEE